MHRIAHCYSRQRSCTSILIISAFLFFLTYSAPHRVHHFFEQVEPAEHHHASDHHGESNHHSQPAKQADCVFQAAASRCLFAPAPDVHLLAPALVVRELEIFRQSAGPIPLPVGIAPIRAPPIA